MSMFKGSSSGIGSSRASPVTVPRLGRLVGSCASYSDGAKRRQINHAGITSIHGWT